MSTVLRSPLITRIWKTPPPTEGAGFRHNRLLDLLASADATTSSFRLLPPENPVLLKRNNINRTWIGDYTRYFPPPIIDTSKPFLNAWENPIRQAFTYTPTVIRPHNTNTTIPPPLFDWPNPIRSRRLPPMDMVERLPPDPGLDQFFDAPGLPPTYDWPVPNGYTYPLSLRSWSQDPISSGLSSLVPSPFIPMEFPNPRGVKFNLMARGWLDSFKLELISQDLFPTAGGANQYDWQNPRGYSYPTSLRTLVISPNIIATTPFHQTDFPNPTLLKYPRDLRTFLQGYENYMTQGATPFNMTDYQNPRGYPYPIGGRTWLKNIDLWLVGQDQFYGAAGETQVYDYPNPLIRKAVHTVYDPNLGFFINLVPPPPAIGTISFRKTFSPIGTGVGVRQRRKDS